MPKENAVQQSTCVYTAEDVYGLYLDISDGEPSAPFYAHVNNCALCNKLLTDFQKIGVGLKELGSIGPHGSHESFFSIPAKDLSEASRVSQVEQVPFEARKTLGPYEIVDEIGRGGMGIVFKAIDTSLNREVALKLIRPDRYTRNEWRESFVEEAKITGRLEHPGIPPVHLLGQNSKGYEFFSMKLMSGRTLAEVLAEKKQSNKNVPREFSLPRLLSIFERVCETVGFAHARGILHRDLKPTNIMIGTHGEVWVLDWGLAKDTTASSNALGVAEQSRTKAPPHNSADGKIVGTIGYMSPEQAHGDVIDARADIYSLGIVLFQILTGSETPPAVAHGTKLKSHCMRALKRVPSVTKALAAICMKCLSPRCADRYESTLHLIEDLRAHLAGNAVSALPDTRLEKLQRWVLRNKKKVAIAIGVSLAGFGAVAIVSVLVAREQRNTRVAEEARVRAEKLAGEKERHALEQEAKAKAAEAQRMSQQLQSERELKNALNEKLARAQKRSAAFQPYSQAMDLLVRGQKFDEAERLARAALAIDADFMEAQFAVAESLRRQGFSRRAADEFMATDALSRKVSNTPNARALLLAGLCYDNEDFSLKALKAFELANSVSTDDPIAGVITALKLIRYGDDKTTKSLIDRLIVEAPHLWEVHYAHSLFLAAARSNGMIERSDAELEQSKAALNRALALSPQNAMLYAGLGCDLKDLSMLDKAVELEPHNGRIRLQRSGLRQIKGDVKGSNEDYALAQSLISPELIETLQMLPESADLKKTVDTLIRQSKESGDVPPFLGLAVVKAISCGRRQEVSAQYQKLIRDFPTCIWAYRAKFWTLFTDRKWQEALDVVREGLKVYPYNTYMLHSESTLLSISGKWTDALNSVLKAEKYADNYKSKFDCLKLKLDILIALKRKEDASKLLAELTEKYPQAVAGFRVKALAQIEQLK
jgi:serine/threonine protein kinase/tetratricopeptide (TPR) repeat protein